MSAFLAKLRQFVFYRTAFLEDELARTRAELERWQNALLQHQGLPSITPRDSKPLPATKSRLLPSQWRSKMEKFSRHEEKPKDVQ